MTMINQYCKLKKSAWSGEWGIRILSQLSYLLELSRAKDGEFDCILEKAIQKLNSWVDEKGAITKEICEDLEADMKVLEKEAKALEVLLIAHAHIDMNWMWGFNETASLTISTFETMLNLMEEYPQFKFSQSQASVYKIVEEYAPYLLPKIRQRIKEGRWEVTASTWVENDKNMSGTEAMVRHILYTKSYLAELLDIDPDTLNIDFEPDTFGHSENLPEILAQGGVKYYYHCRGYQEEHIYRWRAPSGAEVLVYREPVWYNDELSEYDSLGFVPSFCKKYGITKTMKFYGVGDHGGGPTRKEIQHWIKMQAWPLMPKITFGTLKEFYASLEEKREQFSVVDHELNFIFSGCYTSQARVKRANKLGEERLAEAETVQSLVKGFAADYIPAVDLEKGWIKVLFNQFHDILPGSGVLGTYQYAMGEFQKAMAMSQIHMDHAMRELCKKISTTNLGIEETGDTSSYGAGVGFGTGDDGGYLAGFVSRGMGRNRILTVVNPTQYKRKESIKVILWDWDGDLNQLWAWDSSHKEAPVQVTERNVTYWMHKYHVLYLEVEVPGFGYATYVLGEREKRQLDIDWEMFSTTGGRDPRIDQFADEPIVLENSRLKAVFDPLTMLLLEFTDKKSEYSLIGEGTGGFYLALENPVNEMTAWRVGPYMQKVVLNKEKPVRILSRIHGSLYQNVIYQMELEESKLTVEVVLKKDSGILEFHTTLDWHELGNAKKGIPQLGFEVAVGYATNKYRCSVPGGILDRKPWAQDVPCTGFMAAIGENKESLCMMSDCKYGFRGYGDKISLTLLRASCDPDPTPDQGEHHFSIGLGCASDKEEITEKFTGYMNPLYVCSNNVHQGTLPLMDSLLSVEGKVKVLALKQAEDREGMILRIQNIEKTQSHVVVLGKAKEITRAWRTDLTECKMESLPVSNNRIEILLPSASVRTIYIQI